MSRRHRAALVVALPALMGLAACSSKTTSTTPPVVSASQSATTTPSSTATTTASGTALAIASFVYSPDPLTVAPGAKVTVTNSDSAEHTVTSDTKGQFGSDDAKQGKPVTFTAPTAPGTYKFHCQYHASMHGTLIVK